MANDSGGGIYNSGTITMKDSSTVYDNTAPANSGTYNHVDGHQRLRRIILGSNPVW